MGMITQTGRSPMSLSVNRNLFITCALTGSGDTAQRSEHVPVSPRQIADAAIEAAEAGAAVAHIHVRNPETGAPSRDPALYRQTVDYIRQSGVDVVLNLTAGMGGDLVLGSPEAPLPFNAAGTDLAGATERLAHVAEIKPEICTLDCGTMNFGEGEYVMTNTPAMLQEMARQIQQIGTKPEIEIFDTGNLVLAKWLAEQGLIESPVMVQLCMGIPWGAPDDIPTLMSMLHNLPDDWVYSAFSISRNQMAYAALAAVSGGNIRVGLEDNLWLEKGVLATNGQLVARAREIAQRIGCKIMGPAELREKLNLTCGWK
jgi:uncharacterized protein (DUF849 family)